MYCSRADSDITEQLIRRPACTAYSSADPLFAAAMDDRCTGCRSWWNGEDLAAVEAAVIGRALASAGVEAWSWTTSGSCVYRAENRVR